MRVASTSFYTGAALCLLLCITSSLSFAWITFPPPPTIEAFQKALSIAAVTMTVSTTSLAVPGVGHAATQVDFSGSYSDPNHPNCLRVIEVIPGGSEKATLYGTDGNPGCPPNGAGQSWSLTGQVKGNTILVDFTPKGGPPGLKGVWDPTSPAGISWPDGNKWALKSDEDIR